MGKKTRSIYILFTRDPLYLFLKNFFMFIHFWKRETEHKQGWGGETGGHRIWSRLQALRCQHRAWRGAWTHELTAHDLSQSRTLNWLSHPSDPQQTHFRPKDTFRLKIRGWRTIYHANGQQKKAGVDIFISDNLDFKIKTVSRDAEGHYIIIKGSIHQEDLTIVNIYAQNVWAPKYINQLITNIKKLIDSNTRIIGDFNTTLTAMDRSSNQKINKETMSLNDTLDRGGLNRYIQSIES